MNNCKNKIIVILGPTASGKSAVAIKLARKFDGEIISADSRQVYRGMDIGTGKVPKLKCKNQNACPTVPVNGRRAKLQFKNKKLIPYYSAGIAHYLIDIVNPKNNYNVSSFKKDTDKIITDILRRGKLPIICGGTGFWIKTVADNVHFPEVKPDWKLRKKLAKKKITELIHELKKLDPERLKTIDQKNKVRLIRAIEICKALGHVPRLNYESGSMNYEFLQIGIDISKEKLHANIKKRLRKNFQRGMIEEVAALHKKYKLSWKKIQSFGLGYYWIPLYLQEKISRKELFEKIYAAEKDYAKRQMTWFRRDERISWLKNCKDIEKSANNFLK